MALIQIFGAALGHRPRPSSSSCCATAPFQQLARRAPELVCGLNQEFLAGLLAGLRARRVDAVLQSDAAADPTRCVLLQEATH